MEKKTNWYKILAIAFGSILLGFFILAGIGFYLESADTESQALENATFDASTSDTSHRAREIFDEVNQARTENGLKTLPWDTKLAGIAQARSQDMADNNYLDHISPDGKDATSLMKAAKISYFSVGEAIFGWYGVSPDTNLVDETVQGWLKSPGHRAIILDKESYTHAAVGVACTKTDCYITYLAASLNAEQVNEVDLPENYVQFYYLNDPAYGYNYNLQTKIKIEADNEISVYIVQDKSKYDSFLSNGGTVKSLQKFENVKSVDTSFSAAPGNGLIIVNEHSRGKVHVTTTITYFPQ